MYLTNIESVPGMKITNQYGVVSGSTVRAKNAIKDIGAGLKNMVGGELKSYTELLEEARKEAIQRMQAQAQRLGANAVINVRFATSAITAGAAEVYAYGTAVKVEPVQVPETV
ncbi:YbjQ family protein [bacterium]|nr:YbjQ family protein [bacterium]